VYKEVYWIMDNEKRLSITELAELLGVHFNTIRKWEEQFGIVVPRSKDTQRSRYYTEKEISIFTRIRDLRLQNVSIDNIKRLLNRDLGVIEQEEQAIQVLPLSEVSAADMKELIANIIIEREHQLKEEFKREMQKILEEQEQRIIEQITEKHLEQIKSENDRLINYIEEKKEQKKKSIFNWFRKK
jgi:DNA-binding transcriptional MerR regulator